jgi:hypothetical protein
MAKPLTVEQVKQAFQEAGLPTDAACFSCDVGRTEMGPYCQIVFADFSPVWVDDEEGLAEIIKHFVKYH